jgi:hypothetical protein
MSIKRGRYLFFGYVRARRVLRTDPERRPRRPARCSPAKRAERRRWLDR